MINKSFKIIDPAGLHARPAAMLAKEAGKYESDINMIFNDKKANLKSIMNIMAAGVTSGAEIELQAEGSDEIAALEGLEKILKSENII